MIRHLAIASLLFAAALNSFALDPPSPPTYGVRMENQWIPMKDGVRLAVTLYLPEGAKPGEKFPAILEYHPYRKDDAMAEGDYSLYSYFTRRGYVCARVDIRGFGTSEGVPTDREYSEQEQSDGLQIITWLAHQSWSNGNVGMMGISWSGFNSLQMAMLHPPELKAILAAAATDELFHDDIHFIDGMVHIDEFELNMDMAPGITGAPDYTLDEKILAPRFDAPPWSLLYLKHQHDGAVLAQPGAAAERNQDSQFPDRRNDGWLPRQHSRHAGADQGAHQGHRWALEPQLSIGWRFPVRNSNGALKLCAGGITG